MNPIQKSLLRNKNFKQVTILNLTKNQVKNNLKINIEALKQRRRFQIIKKNKRYKVGYFIFALFCIYLFIAIPSL